MNLKFLFTSTCFVLYFVSSNEILPTTSIIIKNNGTCNKCVLKIVKTVLKTAMVIKTNYEEKNGSKFAENLIQTLVDEQIPLIITNEVILRSNDSENKFWDVPVFIYAPQCDFKKYLNIGIIKYGIKYLVLVQESCQEELEEFGALVGEYDVTFLMCPSKKLVTFQPRINPQTCKRQAVIEQLMPCSRLKKPTDVFPDKVIHNFERCPLKVGLLAALTYSFYIITNNTRDLDRLVPNYNVTGSDVEAFNILGVHSNASMLFLVVPLFQYSRSYLLNGKLDVLAGTWFINADKLDGVLFTSAYAFETYFWTYYIERSPRSLQQILNKSEEMYLFMIFYLCFALSWYAVCYFDKRAVSLTKTLLESWGTLFGATSMQGVNTLKQKILNLAYLIMCVHFSTYVGSQVYSLLVIEKPPKTYNSVDDLKKSGMTFFLSQSALLLDMINITTNARYCIRLQDCQLTAIEEKGVAVSTSSIWFKKMQLATAVNDEARVISLPENIFYVFVNAVTRNHGPEMRVIRKGMAQLFESGIMNKLRQEAQGPVDDGARRVAENVLSNSYDCESGCSIRLSELAVAFYALLGGCFSAVCVFVVEILYGKWQKSSRSLKSREKPINLYGDEDVELR